MEKSFEFKASPTEETENNLDLHLIKQCSQHLLIKVNNKVEQFLHVCVAH